MTDHSGAPNHADQLSPDRAIRSFEDHKGHSPAMTIEWTTRVETAADTAVIREINLAAFSTAAEADLVEKLRADPTAWLPDLSWLAVTPDGTVAGFALITRCHIDTVPALALGPVAVLPEYQRQGAGSAAIHAALGAARDRGENLVVLLGHPTYYPRFGFAPASRVGIRWTREVGDEYLMALVFDPARPVPAGTLHYAAAFDEV